MAIHDGREEAGAGRNMESMVIQALARCALFRNVRRAFSQATGLSLKLVPFEAFPAQGTGLQKEKTFCSILQRSSSACAACLGVQREFQRRLRRKLKPETICCFAGLMEVAVPVLIGGSHVATLLGGQVFLKKPKRTEFDKVARQFGQNGVRAELKRARDSYFNIPMVSPQQFHGAVRLLTILADQLGDFASRALLVGTHPEPLCIARAKEFVLGHASEPITLQETANHVHMSRHYFCKIFKGSTGMTFTEFLARARIEKAKALLNDPGLRMSEVAERAGLQSISQFNRQFRHLAGTSPTHFRERLRKLTEPAKTRGLGNPCADKANQCAASVGPR